MLASFGLVVIYRIDDTLARQQAQWFVAGLVLFVATIVLLRDYRKLEQYRYLIAAGSLALLVLPRLPGIGAQVNGAYLGVRIPGVFVFQPTEFAKIGDRHLPRQLPARHAAAARRGRAARRGDHAAAAEALRPAARDLGRGDAAADRDPRPRLAR